MKSPPSSALNKKRKKTLIYKGPIPTFFSYQYPYHPPGPPVAGLPPPVGPSRPWA